MATHKKYSYRVKLGFLLTTLLHWGYLIDNQCFKCSKVSYYTLTTTYYAFLLID